MATQQQSTNEETAEGTILRTDKLVKQYGNFTAIDNVSISVKEGEFRSVIGPNGAGKTTLFNCITGATPITDGAVYFSGDNITGLPPEKRVLQGMGRSFQITNIFGGLNVRENIRLAAQSINREEYNIVESFLKPVDTYDVINKRTEAVLKQIGLQHAADETAEALSYGGKRRLEIGMVLATDPEVVLFDEPAAGMSVEETQDTIDLINDVLTDQTLLLIEHDVDLVMELSDRITVLNRGKVLAEGTPKEISKNQEVQEAYLGGSLNE